MNIYASPDADVHDYHDEQVRRSKLLETSVLSLDMARTRRRLEIRRADLSVGVSRCDLGLSQLDVADATIDLWLAGHVGVL